MPRTFKQPAPPPPGTPKLRTPMKAKSSRSSKENLSLVAEFDDLMRNAVVFHDGKAEQKFLLYVKKTKEWKRRYQHSERERQRLDILHIETHKEGAAKDMKLKYAQEMVRYVFTFSRFFFILFSL